MKAISIFEKLKNMAAGWSWRRVNRRTTDLGVPGELVTSLPPEEREALKDFTATDISEDKVPHNELWYYHHSSKEEQMSDMIKEEKSKFDKKILKDADRPRHRKYDR